MSVMFWAKRIVMVGALVLGGAVAQAATVTFDFSGSSLTRQTLGYTEGGVDLTVSAGRFRPVDGVVINAGRVTRTADGLGVRFGTTDGNDKLDGLGPQELLLFTFSSKVILQSVTFSLIDQGSRFVTFIDGAWADTAGARATNDLSSFATASDTAGIGAFRAQSGFRIESLTVTTVPLPAAGVMLFSGLIGLAALRRKRRTLAA